MGWPLIILLIVLNLGLAHADYDFGSEWKTSVPHPDRILLQHTSQKKYILITRLDVKGKEVEFDQYFSHDFISDASSLRSDLGKKLGETWEAIETGSATIKGFRYGGIHFQANFGESTGMVSERVWVSENKLWHLTQVSLVHEERSQTVKELDLVMEEILPVRRSSFYSHFNTRALAQEEFCFLPSKTSLDKLNSLLPEINRNLDCNAQGIHPGNLAKTHGLKFGSMGYLSCLEGAGDAFKAMKNSFLATMSAWEAETKKEIQKFGCMRPPKPKSFIEYIGHGHAMTAYSHCLSGASSKAGAGLAMQSLVQTAESLKALYYWVKAEENPVSVIASIIASKYDGFMCLTAEAQLNAICEFSTHVLTNVAIAAVGAGTASAIKNGISAVRRMTKMPLKKAMGTLVRALSPRELAALAVRKKIGGVSSTFLNPHPFVRKVANGQAEASRVLRALSEGAILKKSPGQIDNLLRQKGFIKLSSCIKLQGKCVRHINPATGLEEVAPMVVYVHPSGVAARLKPHGQSNAKFRPGPHGSFMLVDPDSTKLSQGIAQLRNKNINTEDFMDRYLSWDQELAKIDMRDGSPLPKAPAATRVPAELTKDQVSSFNDTLSDITHFSLQD